MAEPENIEQVIERTIRIYLEQEGSRDVANGIKAVKAEIDKLRKAAKDLGDDTFNLNQEMKNNAKLYVKGEKDGKHMGSNCSWTYNFYEARIIRMEINRGIRNTRDSRQGRNGKENN